MVRKRVTKYPEAFRRMALERLKNSASVSAYAQVGVHRTVLYYWLRQAGPQGTDATATSPVRELREQVRDLKRVLAGKTPEMDFFKGALQKSNLDARAAEALSGRHLRPNPRGDGRCKAACISSACTLARVGRAGLYRSLQQARGLFISFDGRLSMQKKINGRGLRTGSLCWWS